MAPSLLPLDIDQLLAELTPHGRAHARRILDAGGISGAEDAGGGDGGGDAGGGGGDAGAAAGGDGGVAGDKGDGDKGGAAGDGALGDAGKKALDEERTARRTAERVLKEEREAKAKLEEELAKHRDENKSENEKAIEKARKEADEAARAEVASKYEQQLLEGRVLVKAAGKLADPADANLHIKAEDLEKEADGTVSDKTIEAAIAKLVKDKEYLAAGATPGGPGSADGGARGGRPGQLSRADIQKMSPEQIVEAKAKGQLADLMRGGT